MLMNCSHVEGINQEREREKEKKRPITISFHRLLTLSNQKAGKKWISFQHQFFSKNEWQPAIPNNLPFGQTTNKQTKEFIESWTKWINVNPPPSSNHLIHNHYHLILLLHHWIPKKKMIFIFFGCEKGYYYYYYYFGLIIIINNFSFTKFLTW